MFDELLLTVDGAGSEVVQATRMADLELHERQHLQEWILAHPQVLGANVEVIASEYADWQDATGGRVADRLDILGVDGDGRLVVAELKRDEAPHTINMQAINYAAMVSRLGLQDVAEMYVARRHRLKNPVEFEAALDWLQTVKLVTTETLKQPRIVLVATHFPVAVTSSAVWLNEQGVDLTLVRFRPYKLTTGQVVVAFSQLFPVPDVEDFTIGRRPGTVTPTPPTDAGPPWDEAALTKLARVGNAATIAVMDLCAAPDVGEVRVVDIMEQASISSAQVKGHLAGLTMLLKNKKNGFPQNTWPFLVSWTANGLAIYQMDSDLAEMWRSIRGIGISDPLDDPEPPTPILSAE
jgi:hypothetical protein